MRATRHPPGGLHEVAHKPLLVVAGGIGWRFGGRHALGVEQQPPLARGERGPAIDQLMDGRPASIEDRIVWWAHA